MNEHDEEQPPPRPRRGATRRGQAAEAGQPDAGPSDPAPPPPPWATGPPPPWAAGTPAGPSGYPYTNPSTAPASAGRYQASPAYPGAPGNAGSPSYPESPPYTASPTSPGVGPYPGPPAFPTSPPYPGAPTYPGGPAYPASPPYDAWSQEPGPALYPDLPGYPAYRNAPGYPAYNTNPGWSSGWQPPPPHGYGSWGPAPQPSWAPLPPAAPPSRRRAVTIVVLAILVAAFLGLSIGGELVGHSDTTRSPSVFPFQPPGASPGPGARAGGGGVPTTGGGLPAGQAAAIASAVDPSVVDINAKLGYQRAGAAGTGMVLTSDGQVLTNNHVIAGATTLRGAVVGGKSYDATVLGTDPSEDVALIKLEGASGLKPIRTGDPSKLAVGDPIVAVGNAGGVGGTPSIVTGTVAALDQSVTASDMGGGNSEQLHGLIQINAALQPGDSGGPLINASSQVVGMDTAASASNRVESQISAGFAIPITRAIAIAQQIAAGHGSATIQIGLPGFIGVSIASTSQFATGGAPISAVIPGTPAEKAGLAAGDVITSVGGQAVDSPKSLSSILQQRHPGEKVIVSWTDTAGHKHSAQLTLITGPAA